MNPRVARNLVFMDDATSTWWWRTGASAGARRMGETFAARSEAEAWLSSAWEDLLDEGVEEVTLMHGEEAIYGPMPLHA